MGLMFGQLSNRESLRDVVDGLETNQPSVGSVDIYWGYHAPTILKESSFHGMISSFHAAFSFKA